VEGSYEYGNKTSGAVKSGEFLDQLRNYKLLKKVFAPWSSLTVIEPFLKIILIPQSSRTNLKIISSLANWRVS
jgi:hypothetical protein